MRSTILVILGLFINSMVFAGISVSSSSLNFGTLPTGKFETSIVTVTNTGDEDISGGLSTSDNCNIIKVWSYGCIGTLAANHSCVIQVEFGSASPVSESCSVNIFSTGYSNAVYIEGRVR